MPDVEKAWFTIAAEVGDPTAPGSTSREYKHQVEMPPLA